MFQVSKKTKKITPSSKLTKIHRKKDLVRDEAKRDQLINEIHTLFRISKSHFLIELYDALLGPNTIIESYGIRD